MQSVDWIDNNSAWIVSKFLDDPTGFALRTDDGGSNWFKDEDTPGGNWVFTLDENTAWIMIQGSPLTEPAILYRTTDGGVNWITSTLPAGYIDGFTWVSADLGWAFGGAGNIRHTTDGGVTWVVQNMNTPNYIADIHFINPLEGWACGYYGSENAFIRHTVDGGATWTTQNPPSTSALKDIHFFDSDNGMAVAKYGLVLGTSNGGATWSVISTIVDEDLEVLVMLNSTTGWATGVPFTELMTVVRAGPMNGLQHPSVVKLLVWPSIRPNTLCWHAGQAIRSSDIKFSSLISKLM